MQRAMQARFGGPQQQRAATPPAPPRRGQSRPLADEIMRSVSTTLSGAIPFNEEIGSAVVGAGNAMSEGIHGRNPVEGYQRGYRGAVDNARADNRDFRARRPIVADLLTGTGGALPILATAGGGAAPSIANAAAQGSRGLPLLLRQMTEGAANGALWSGLFAAGNEDGGDVSQRLQAGNEAMPAGATLGAAAPIAVNGFSALGSLASRALPRRGGPPMRNVTPPPEMPPSGGAPATQMARASDGSVLPVRPAEPFRQSHVGGSEDLRAAARPRPPMDDAARLAQLREQGFNVDQPLFHGTTRDFENFSGDNGNIYLTHKPELASMYADGEGGNVRPVYARNAERVSENSFMVRNPSDVQPRFGLPQQTQGDGALPRRPLQMGDNAGPQQGQMRGQDNPMINGRNSYLDEPPPGPIADYVGRLKARATGQEGYDILAQLANDKQIGKDTLEEIAGRFLGARLRFKNKAEAVAAIHERIGRREWDKSAINLMNNPPSKPWVKNESGGDQQQSSIPRQYPQMPAKPQPQFGMTLAPPNNQFYSNPIPFPRRTGGPKPPRPPAASGPPRLPGDVVRTVDTLASRRRMSATDVERAIGEARQKPQGRVLADLFDDPGVRTLRSIAQRPGETGQRATERASERFHAAPVRILRDLERRMSVSQTRQAAIEALSKQYKEVSANLYRPIFERQTTTEQKLAIGAAVERIERAPLTRGAISRARSLFATDRELGLVEGGITDNAARYAHYVKMALDDLISSRTRTGGLTGNALRASMEAKSQLLNAMDDTIPGYRDARAQWGGLKEAEDALDEGAHFLSMSSDEVRAAMGEMTPFAQYHARIGLAHELHQRLGLRGSVNGNRNVAEVLGSPEMQARVAAAFDSPDQAVHFLDTLNTQNRLMRNAGQWGTGSQTYSNLTHGDDQNSRALMEAGGHAASGNPIAAIGRLARRGVDAAVGHRLEQSDNRVGEALLRPIDEGASAKEFTDQVIAELRRLETMRNSNTRTSRVAASAAGAQTGRNRKRP
jgi:hypothetical protein